MILVNAKRYTKIAMVLWFKFNTTIELTGVGHFYNLFVVTWFAIRKLYNDTKLIWTVGVDFEMRCYTV